MMAAFITIPNERDASLADWLNSFGYLIARDRRWLMGIVATDLLCIESEAAPRRNCKRNLSVGKGVRHA
jgi:hypothetical protein